MADLSQSEKEDLFKSLRNIEGHMGQQKEFMENAKASLASGTTRFAMHDKRIGSLERKTVTWPGLAAAWTFLATVFGAVLWAIGIKK